MGNLSVEVPICVTPQEQGWMRGYCPVCGAGDDDLDFQEFTATADGAEQYVTCHKCEARFVEVHALVGFEILSTSQEGSEDGPTES